MKRYVYILLTLAILFPYSVFAYMEEDAYQLTSIAPADSSILNGFSKDDVITFTTNADSIFGGFNVVIWDSNTNNIIYEDFTVDQNSEDEWVLTIYENLFFLKGHTYLVELIGHEGKSPKSEVIAKFSAYYLGNSTGTGEEDDTDYEYSNIVFSEYLKDGFRFENRQNRIYITFSGEGVTIDEERSMILDEDSVVHKFTTISPYEKNPKYEQELYFDIEILDSCISHFTVFIYAKDKGGRVVKGNAGKGRNSHLELTYLCDFGYPKLQVTPEDDLMMAIPSLSFSHTDGISILNEGKQINFFGDDKETIVQTIKIADLEESSNQSSYSYHFDESFDSLGVYYLYIPDSTFALSKKHKQLPNREKWVRYEITDKLGVYGVSITPEETDTIPSLSKITITFYRWDSVIPYYHNPDTITVTEEIDSITTVVSVAFADYDFYRTIENQCFIQLETPITKSGHYKVNVPPNTFILGSDRKNLSDSLFFEFNVKEPEFVPAFCEVVETVLDESLALRHILVEFPDYELARVASYSADAILIQTDSIDVEVKEVARGKILIGRYRNEVCITLYDDFILKTENNYKLILPANSIILNGERYKFDLEVPFHFDPSTSGIYHLDMASADDHVRVYNLQGMLIREGNSKEVLEGLKGLYIINGRKILIK